MRTANWCLRSCSRGRHSAERGSDAARRASAWKVWATVLGETCGRHRRPAAQLHPDRGSRSIGSAKVAGHGSMCLGATAAPSTLPNFPRGREHPAVGMKVAAVQGDRLAATHPGHGMQPDQRSERRNAVRRGQRSGGGDQRTYFRVAVEERSGPAAPVRQQLSAGTSTGTSIEHAGNGRTPDRPRRFGWDRVDLGDLSPMRAPAQGDRLDPARVEMVEELAEHLFVALQPETERATDAQIVSEVIAQRRHAFAPATRARSA